MAYRSQPVPGPNYAGQGGLAQRHTAPDYDHERLGEI